MYIIVFSNGYGDFEMKDEYGVFENRVDADLEATFLNEDEFLAEDEFYYVVGV